MMRITVLALTFLALGGCGLAAMMQPGDVDQRFDASTGTSTAVIAGTGAQPFHPTCKILHGEHPYGELVIDAGPVLLLVECHKVVGVLDGQAERLGRASVAFAAHAGHSYRIAVSDEFGFYHVEVIDRDLGAKVIQRSLLDVRYSTIPVAAVATLVARSGDGVISCTFARPWHDRRFSSIRRPAESYADQPFSHRIIAECSTYAYLTGDVKELYRAPLDFVPVSGRLYTVHMDESDPDFLLVTDVSSTVETIAHVRAVRLR